MINFIIIFKNMKKNILWSIAICAIALFTASCGSTEVDELQSITLLPEVVKLTPGTTQRLTVQANPTSVKIDTKNIVWKSSNDSVAQVSSVGNITANNYGTANITATYSDGKNSFEATCQVNVVTYLETLEFTQCFPWFFTIPDSTDIREIKTSQKTYKCYRVMVDFLLFSDGLYMNNDLNYDGSEIGAVIEFTAPAYYGDTALNGEGNAAYFWADDWFVTTQSPWSADLQKVLGGDFHIGEPGKITDEAAYIGQANKFLEFINRPETEDLDTTAYRLFWEETEKYVTGSKMNIIYYNCDESGNNCGYRYYGSNRYVPNAFVNRAQVQIKSGERGASQYMGLIAYFYGEFTEIQGTYGWDITKDEATNKYVLASNELQTETFTLTNGTPKTSASTDDEDGVIGLQMVKESEMPIISQNPVLKEKFDKFMQEMDARNMIIKLN